MFVSAALRPEGRVAPILHLVAEGGIAVFVSSCILSELERTLASTKIGFEAGRIRETPAAVRDIVSIVEPKVRGDPNAGCLDNYPITTNGQRDQRPLHRL